MRDGHCSIDKPLPRTSTTIRDDDFNEATATTDAHGDARFLLAPGRYTVVKLDYDCSGGSTGLASATVTASRTTRVQSGCGLP